MPKVLVTGAKGQVGSEIRELSGSYSNFTFHYVDKEELDLNASDKIQAFFSTHTFDVVIHCAAFTAVDQAEATPDLAHMINATCVETMLKCLEQKDTAFILISTDYVFDGTAHRPIAEDAKPNPLSVYGKTKHGGELAVLNANRARSVIIRTSWVYSSFGHNFVKTMMKLGSEREALSIVADQIGTPTYARDLADAILRMISHSAFDHLEQPDIFHFSNEGVASWYDFSTMIMTLSDIDCAIKPIPTEAYPLPAARPYYSVMDKTKIKKTFGLDIAHWSDALKRCLSIM